MIHNETSYDLNLNIIKTKILYSNYRKYRPDLPSYKRHYRQWWQFAYRCILEEEVRRRHRNWNWAHMLAHRQLCRDYAAVYQCKLTNRGKVNSEQLVVLEKAEKTLDLFNLVVIRQRIEMEVCISHNRNVLVNQMLTFSQLS